MSLNKSELESRLKKTIEHFKKELGHMRSARASVGILDGIHVDYYGSSVPLQQLGLINAPESRLIVIQVYDKAAVESVVKAIMQSDVGITPSTDGNLIRLNVPTLTEERRKDLVKKLHKFAEESRIGIRNTRRDIIDDLKKQQKNKEISEDDLHKGQEEVQKITDKYISEIEHLLQIKEKEMMEV